MLYWSKNFLKKSLKSACYLCTHILCSPVYFSFSHTQQQKMQLKELLFMEKKEGRWKYVDYMCRWLKVILVNSPSHESGEITYTNLLNSSSLSNFYSIRLWISMDSFNKLDPWTRTMNLPETFKKSFEIIHIKHSFLKFILSWL